MPRKPVRGRFLIVLPLSGGGSWKCESNPALSIGPTKMAVALRKYADFIERHLVPDSSAGETATRG